MSAPGTRRFVADLLSSRRPRSFRADDADVAQLRAAIALRAAAPGSAAPRTEFVTDLHQRLAAQLSAPDRHASRGSLPARPAVDPTRRRLVQTGSIAAAAATAGAVMNHLMTARAVSELSGTPAETLTPTATGVWRTVSTSTDLAKGQVQAFDLGTIVGFVARTDGQLQAVSALCTHLGCRLAFDAAARRLNCPCHTTSFAINGQLLRYQLPAPPPPLPHFPVREIDGAVQVFAPV